MTGTAFCIKWFEFCKNYAIRLHFDMALLAGNSLMRAVEAEAGIAIVVEPFRAPIRWGVAAAAIGVSDGLPGQHCGGFELPLVHIFVAVFAQLR